jgi:hypothetical protein
MATVVNGMPRYSRPAELTTVSSDEQLIRRRVNVAIYQAQRVDHRAPTGVRPDDHRARTRTVGRSSMHAWVWDLSALVGGHHQTAAVQAGQVVRHVRAGQPELFGQAES